jgi:predicted protein tyrosine phosphatase
MAGGKTLRDSAMADLIIKVCGLAELPKVSGYWDLFGSFVDPEWSAIERSDHIYFGRQIAFRCHDIIENVPGRVSPSVGHVTQWIQCVKEATADRHNPSILINCHLGLSRSVAAAAIAFAVIRADLDEVPKMLHTLSSKPWPNSRMLSIADDLLQLGGRLSSVGVRTRFETARCHPDWVRELAATDRRAEVLEVWDMSK